MANYTNVFGDNTLPPSGQTYRLISLTDHVRLQWPENYEGDNFLADINNVAQSAANYHISLPDATGASVGRDFLVRNVGLFPFQVDNVLDVPVATLQPGEVKYFYLTDNSNTAGVWNAFTFGTGTSSADASQLAGKGLTVVGSKLAAARPVRSIASDVTAITEDRATVFVFTGGSNTLTLPSAVSLGDNWFCGVRNSGSGSITIAITGVDRIDDQINRTLSPGESLFVYCTGATYYTLGYGRSTQFQFTKLVKDVSAGGNFFLTSGEAANKLLQFTGTPADNVTIVVPTVVSVYYVHNDYSGNATLTMKTAAGTGVTLTNGNAKAIMFCDGVNVVSASVSSSVTIIDNGGGTGGGGGTTTVEFNGLINDGTVTAPGVAFASDTNTGFFRIGVDTFGVATGGVQSAMWSTTAQSVKGKFGIGTDSPTSQLDVRGMGLFSGGAALSGTLPAGTMLQLGGADAQETRIMVDSYGGPTGAYVTLRQSRGTASAPTATLVEQNLGAITWRGRGATTWSSDRAYIIGRASQNWTDTAQGSMILFAVTPNNTVAPAVKMVLDQNGWLCIGEDDNPATQLDVRGGLRVVGNIEARRIGAAGGAFPLVVECTDPDDHSMIQFRYTQGGDGMDVGYLMADPTYPLKVMTPDTFIEGFRVRRDTGGVDAYAFNNVSDERLKENWGALPDNFLDLLSTIKHGTYSWTRTGQRQVGISAQSLLAVLPEAVAEDDKGFLSVSYGNAAMVACVQLAKAVSQLRMEVDSLRRD